MHLQNALRKPLLAMALAGLVATTAVSAGDARPSEAADTRTQITTLLTNFLTPAVNNSPAGHDRFWADDLVYTSSKGEVMRKPDIMKSFADAPKPAPGAKPQPEPTYTAEDILVRPYGDAAALTFRLVVHEAKGKVSYYRNSGMFVKRAGKWQAVTWQATKVAETGARK